MTRAAVGQLGAAARVGALVAALVAIGAGPGVDAGPTHASPTHAETSTVVADRAALEARRKAEEAERARIAEIEREYAKYEDEAAAEPKPTNVVPTQASDGPTLMSAFLKMVFALGGIVFLAYVLLGKVLPKVMKIEPPAAQRRIMTVVDRMPIDQRRSIMILRIGASHYLVGASEQTISLLSKLDDDEIERALAASEPRPGPTRLTSVFARKSDKSS